MAGRASVRCKRCVENWAGLPLLLQDAQRCCGRGNGSIRKYASFLSSRRGTLSARAEFRTPREHEMRRSTATWASTAVLLAAGCTELAGPESLSLDAIGHNLAGADFAAADLARADLAAPNLGGTHLAHA